MDDLVLNIEEFGWRHPGGSFVIDHNVGRDVSKFFHGGYALSGNSTDPSVKVPRIQHTNYARWIASDLAIGRFVRSSQSFKVTVDKQMTKRVNKDTKTYFFKQLSSDYKSTDEGKSEITSIPALQPFY